jgi:hypothetical protein
MSMPLTFGFINGTARNVCVAGVFTSAWLFTTRPQALSDEIAATTSLLNGW